MENLFPADITSLLSELETESAKFLVSQLNVKPALRSWPIWIPVNAATS
jgi:hypothetical protein